MGHLNYYLKFLPYLVKIVYFNFHYLPFRQACRLPIFLYKPKLYSLKGSLRITANKITPGMIRMGEFVNTCSPNCGVSIDNRGGEIVFEGRAVFANDSHFMLTEGAKLIIGDNVDANCTIKCAERIEIGANTWIAYETMIMDSDWHSLTDVVTGKLLKKTAPVIIGKNNFLSFRCLVMKGTKTHDYAVFAQCSVLNKVFAGEEYSLYGGSPCELIDEGYYLDINNN